MSAKRKGLGIDIDLVAEQAKTLGQPKDEPRKAKPDCTVTAVNLPKDLLALLRLVAAHRANRRGGRASVSHVLSELLEENRARLEEEIKAG